MVVDFKKLNLHERPTLILRNMDCKAFGVLGRAFNITADLKFNEVSSISFDYPAIDNGELVPFYNSIKAMGIIDVKDLGQFILKDVKRNTDGIREVKSCTAYSLEYELSYKQFFAEKGTYNFWNPVAPKNTILGMIFEKVPYWSIGYVDPALIGRYRTFEAENVNVYDFIKNTVQNAFGCVFTFETYARKINVTSVTSIIPTSQVFLSLDNLIKDINVNEDTENINTCMEAFGADDLNIRSVNPIGTNKIYNLDYFMTTENVSQAIIDKWAAWEKLFDDRQLPYYNLMIEESIQSSRLLTEKTVLTDMKGELKKLETLQSTSVQYLGEHPNDSAEQERLDKINADIKAQKQTIAAQEALLASIQADMAPISAEKAAINKELAFETTFTDEEVASLSKYIKENSVQDSSFVVSTVKDYNTADTSSKHENAAFDVSASVVTRIANPNSKELYSMVGGKLACPCGDKALSADIVRGTLERKNDGNFVFSAYLNSGKIGDVTFPSGNISVTGVAGAVSTDVVPGPDVPDAYATGTRLSYTATTARVYFTQNATEYEARAVQFDLFDYAKTCLDKASVPSYSFSVNSANFLALDEFIAFKNNFTLGERVYLDIEGREASTRILRPVVIGINIDFETLSNFSLEFSDKFSSSDVAFEIVDMLKQSIFMGKKYSSDQYSTTAFTDSGAAETIESYIINALDVSKQDILATVGQAFSLDENGFRMRKWLADHSGYEPQQIWMNNNAINFTSDNWDHVRTALGKVTVGDGTLYGLVAEVIIGMLVAGKNLAISSEKAHGGIAEFRVDENGAKLYNSTFELATGEHRIGLIPNIGIASGLKNIYQYDVVSGEIIGIKTNRGYVGKIADLGTGETPNTGFWADMNGDGYFKGTVYATNGEFIGKVYASEGRFNGLVGARKFIA